MSIKPISIPDEVCGSLFRPGLGRTYGPIVALRDPCPMHRKIVKRERKWKVPSQEAGSLLVGVHVYAVFALASAKNFTTSRANKSGTVFSAHCCSHVLVLEVGHRDSSC